MRLSLINSKIPVLDLEDLGSVASKISRAKKQRQEEEEEGSSASLGSGAKISIGEGKGKKE